MEDQLNAIQEALEDMVWQFAYRGTRGRSVYLGTGGLSAFEGAFMALGWEDPYRCGIENACEVFGCFEWHVAGTPWRDWL